MAKARKNQRYTQEEQDLLVSMYEGGTAVATIARKLGRTKHAINVRVARLGISRKELAHRTPSTSETERILRTVLQSGLSTAKKLEIATSLI